MDKHLMGHATSTDGECLCRRGGPFSNKSKYNDLHVRSLFSTCSFWNPEIERGGVVCFRDHDVSDMFWLGLWVFVYRYLLGWNRKTHMNKKKGASCLLTYIQYLCFMGLMGVFIC